MRYSKTLTTGLLALATLTITSQAHAYSVELAMVNYIEPLDRRMTQEIIRESAYNTRANQERLAQAAPAYQNNEIRKNKRQQRIQDNSGIGFAR